MEGDQRLMGGRGRRVTGHTFGSASPRQQPGPLWNQAGLIALQMAGGGLSDCVWRMDGGRSTGEVWEPGEEPALKLGRRFLFTLTSSGAVLNIRPPSETFWVLLRGGTGFSRALSTFCPRGWL